MKRALGVAITFLALTLPTLDAAAQEAAAPVVVQPPPTPIVRIHARAYRDNVTARIYSHRADDSWVMVCAAPCTFDAPAGSELRITMGSYEDEPHSFIVPGDAGPEMDLEIKAASVGPLVGGIVMMGSGAAFALTGLIFLAIADVSVSGNKTNNHASDEAKTIGYVFVGIGVAAAAGGLVWLLSRSHEPRTQEKRHHERPPPIVYGRAETLLGDVAAARPRDPTKPPLLPLQLNFTF